MRDVLGSFRRGAYRDDFKMPQVTPSLDPSIEQGCIISTHELKAPKVVKVYPTVYILKAGRQLATPITSTTIDVNSRAYVEVLNDHVQH